MSQCKKFAPNIFNKTKCSNCFRQKEEHSAVALECNRASRTTARSGYLFLAPDWDFSVPLNRTKRWQRRWFVLYDDGELSYSVDEHPDTIPQGSVDMSQVLEVTSAEQLTGHPHSLALTAPDRVTFVKAASREDARWWLELLAVFPRRHKRNATFPGGRASPSLPHLGRSASPQPPRPMRHMGEAGGGGSSPRTNFTTPAVKEERDPNAPTNASPLASLTTSGSSSSVGSTSSPRCSLVGVILKEDVVAAAAAGIDMVDHRQHGGGPGRPQWVPEPSAMMTIGGGDAGVNNSNSTSSSRDALLANPRTEYLISSGSPPTRDKLRCEDKARARRDWRHERLRDIATALTDRSPESSLALPAEGLLHLKKGWLWHREATSSPSATDSCEQWRRRWWVLCGPSLLGYRDQDEEAGGAPLVSVELAAVTGYSELRTDTRFGFQLQWSGGPPLTLSAVTMGIRSNWLQALRKAAPGIIESPAPLDNPPTAPTTGATSNSSSSSIPSSASSSRHSTASSSQLTAAVSAITQPPSAGGNIRLRGDTTLNCNTNSIRLSTGSSSGGGTTPTTPRSGVIMFSSDEEYRTASEGGRRDSMTDVDWMTDCGSGASMAKSLLSRSKDERIQQRQSRPHKLPRCQSASSRHSTLDSNVSSPDDELDTTTHLLANNQSTTTEADHSARLYHHRHSVADMRSRKLHLQLQLDEEDKEQRRRKTAAEKELEIARGEVRALEEEARRLRGLLSEATSKELKGRDAVYELEKIERDLTQKLEKLLREQKSLNRRLSESDEAIRESDERSATLNRELQAKQRIVASLQDELTCANERCAASRLENDRLYKKLQELNNNSPPTITPPHLNPPPLQSISHLTNIDLDSPLTSLSNSELTHHCLDLRIRFERAVAEIRELQQRLREAQAQVDVLQLERLRFNQRVEAARGEYDDRLGMLKERVEDLTGKLLQAERARLRASAATAAGGARGQREGGSSGSGGGSKIGRRSLSLKGRESFSVNKEVEDKVTLLEAKLLSLSNQPPSPNITADAQRGRTTRRSKYQPQATSSGRRSTDNVSPIDDRSLRKLRRKSLDGATASEPMKLLMRLNALEERMGGGVDGGSGRASSESLNGAGGEGSGGATTVAEESETETLSLARATYLLCINPSTPQQSTLLDMHHMRELGKILRVPDIDNSSVVSDATVASAHSIVAQLEGVLRRQYTELYERRLRLRERGELDSRAQIELLAEKIAFEDVIIGRIFSTLPQSTSSPSNSPNFISREILETKHLLNHIQSKLNLTSSTPQSTSSTYLHTSVSYLTQLFTRHLLANATTLSSPIVEVSNNNMLTIDEASLKELLLEQRKVHEMLEEYQRVKLGQLVKRLLADTMMLVRDDDSCSLVGEVSGKVWDVARRRVSEELIQSEMRHVLMKTAQQYEHLNSSDHTAGYSFTLTAVQRCQIEQWTDSVEDHLLSRMEHFITHLNNTYQSTHNVIPHQPTDSNSADLFLHEYADVIAHVALIDARIATLQMKCAVSEREDGVGIICDDDDDLNVLLLARGQVSDVSVVEFKAALKVARLCAGHAVEGGVKIADTSSCAKCLQRQDLNWMGPSYTSYDSLPELTSPSLPPSATIDPTTTVPSPPTPTTYHHQIALLRLAFQQTLTDQQSTTVEQQRHLHLVESSVERLRVVCEQVLVAMERMHRGALQRMRVNHTEELEGVRREKEQALAEETQATLAALDAMRKAHEAEVVKEVARFKHELARQQASELLELRERLSVKCLEAAALQEQLSSATRQLAHAHQHILHLEQQRAPSAS